MRIKRKIFLMMIWTTIRQYLKVLLVLRKEFATLDKVCNGGCVTPKTNQPLTTSLYMNKVDFQFSSTGASD